MNIPGDNCIISSHLGVTNLHDHGYLVDPHFSFFLLFDFIVCSYFYNDHTVNSLSAIEISKTSLSAIEIIKFPSLPLSLISPSLIAISIS